MISVGIMRGVYPAVLRGWREGGRAAAKPLLDQGVRLYLLIAVPAVAGLTAVALPLSRFLYPEEYSAGAPVIAYTALAMLFMGLTEYANKAYELEQSTGQVLQNSAAAAVIKVISSIILLRAFGFTGGAIGSVVAFASYFIITCVRVRRRFLFRVPARSVCAHRGFRAAVRRGGLGLHAAAGRQHPAAGSRSDRGRSGLCGVHHRFGRGPRRDAGGPAPPAPVRNGRFRQCSAFRCGAPG